VGVSWEFRGQEFRGQTGPAHWENRTTLRFKGELALTAIDNRESAFVKVPVPQCVGDRFSTV
jgi:hypothetical protein